MTKNFTINNTAYTVTECTAIALCDMETGDRQNALLVENTEDSGEIVRFVVFGYGMPETVEGFSDMCEDFNAWESDCDCLDTVEGVEGFNEESEAYDIYTDEYGYVGIVTAKTEEEAEAYVVEEAGYATGTFELRKTSEI